MPIILQIGKFRISNDLKIKQKKNPTLAKDVAAALYAHITGMWAENAAEHYEEARNGERITAIFPTVCGNIVIDTLADRTQTTISMV